MNIFERYTERARRVVFFARLEASELGSDKVESEHLLLALIKEDKKTFNHFGFQQRAAEQIREEVIRLTKVKESKSMSIEANYSDETVNIMTHVVEEANAFGHNFVSAEDFLPAILKEEKSLAAEILRRHGFVLEQVRGYLAKSSSKHRREILTFAEKQVQFEAFLVRLETVAARIEKAVERFERPGEKTEENS